MFPRVYLVSNRWNIRSLALLTVTTALLAAICAADAYAAPQVIAADNPNVNQYIATGFAVDGDWLYWQYTDDDGSVIRRADLRTQSVTDVYRLPKLTDTSWWAEEMIASQGNVAFTTSNLLSNTSFVRDGLHLIQSQTGSLRTLASHRYKWTRSCTSKPGLGTFSASGELLYFDIRSRKTRGKCRSANKRTHVYSVPMATRPDLPPSPTRVATLKGGEPTEMLQSGGNLLFARERSVSALSLATRGARTVTRDKRKRPAGFMELEVSASGQVLSSEGTKGTWVWSPPGGSRLFASAEKGAPKIVLTPGSHYKICGDTLVRWNSGTSSSIDVVANPFSASAAAPRTILPRTTIRIGWVECGARWIAFRTSSDKTPEHLWFDSL